MPPNTNFMRAADDIGVTTANFVWSEAEKKKWRDAIAQQIVPENKKLKNKGLKKTIFAIGRDDTGAGIAVGITFWTDKGNFKKAESAGDQYATQRDQAIQQLGGTNARTMYLEVIDDDWK